MTQRTSKSASFKRVQDHLPAALVPGDRTPCVWMEAGVLTWWICDRNLECATCPLDAALRHKDFEPDDAPPRLDHPGKDDPEQDALRPVRSGALDAQALYAPTHVWLRSEAFDRARVGLDGFAAGVAGRLRCVVLVPPKTCLERGAPCAWLDQPGGTLTVRSPVSSVVLAVNEALVERGDLELTDPFGNDWLLLVQPTKLRQESKWLRSARQHEIGLAEHERLWHDLLRRALRAGATDAGMTLADGGRTVTSPHELLGARRHHRIASRFLSGTMPRARDLNGEGTSSE